MGDTCIGDPDQLASLLEKASLENDDRVHRFVPAGEVVYRVACPKKRYGATGGGNCSELLPVKELSPQGKLEGEQLYLLPQTRYCTRHDGVVAVQTSPQPTLRTTDGSTPGLEED